MKLAKVILSFVLVSTAISCKTETTLRIEDASPRISEGYYAIENPEKHNVPLVAIIKSKGQTYAYSFYWYECEGIVSASYENTGITFSDSPASIGGANVTVVGKNCDLDTSIIGDSDSTIKIKAKLNQVKQTAYVLKKVSKRAFLTSLSELSKEPDYFRVSEETCQKSLGQYCGDLKIEPKE